MKLQKIEIFNFRSIESASFNFGAPSALIFVGINESGKSNILRAMNLLSKGVEPSRKDVRIARSNDLPIAKSQVNFLFQLNTEQLDQASEEIHSKVVALNKNDPIIEMKGESLSLHEFVQKRREVLYVADMMKATKAMRYFLLPKGSKVSGNWAVANNSVQPGTLVTLREDSRTVPVQSGQLVHLPSLEGPPPSWLDPLTIEQLNKLLGETTTAIAEDNLPNSILWEYTKENTLPSEIDVEAFASNPESCIPLKHIFELAGENNIGVRLRETKAQGIHYFKGLLNRVSAQATDYLKEVWKDHKKVSIKLEPNGPLMTISISEGDTSFSFEQRSDGFKRFATFLLLVAARVRTNRLENELLLLDEPEISLHPSGTRNLRDELLRIAKTNYVVIATHSQYMVDREDFSRNRVVSKKDEITRIDDIGDSSKMYEEEVLLSALGTSVFEVVKERNVIFEGWRDKRLFEVFRSSIKKTSELANLLSFGCCHAQGVKDIKNLVPFFQVCDRELLIVTDSDNPAVERKKDHIKERMHGNWLTYADLLGENSVIEAEDFIKRKNLVLACAAANEKIGSQIQLDEANIPFENRVKYVKTIVTASLTDSEAVRNWLDAWKSAVFDNLKRVEIEDRYNEIAKSISAALTPLPTTEPG